MFANASTETKVNYTKRKVLGVEGKGKASFAVHL